MRAPGSRAILVEPPPTVVRRHPVVDGIRPVVGGAMSPPIVAWAGTWLAAVGRGATLVLELLSARGAPTLRVAV
jgi:hypothetical protein